MVTISCDKCSKVYRIPEEKLPTGKKFAVPCPNCKALITVDLREKSPEPSGPISLLKPQQKPNRLKKVAAPDEKKPLTGRLLKEKILKSVKDLPSMPAVVEKAQTIMANPAKGIKDLTNIIETDQAITTKMLKLGNSAFYGLSGKVSTVQKAITMLGQETLREVLMTAGYSNMLDKPLEGYEYDPGDLWRHSIAVAIGAKIIAEIKKFEDPNSAYLAGLIHDSGKLILDPYILKMKPDFDRFLEDEANTFLMAERHVFGFDHADIAFEVSRKWNVPETIASSIRYHHYPSLSMDNTLSYIVHLANHMAKTGGLGYGDDDYLSNLEEGSMAFLELNETVVQKVSTKIIEIMLKFQN